LGMWPGVKHGNTAPWLQLFQNAQLNRIDHGHVTSLTIS
jgi:hypothetical protein